ncbi:hypothetical protein Tco_1333048, partial [Tanacetum coccineum]
LGKSISKTEAEATRQVHATHVRIVIQSILEPTRRRKSSKVTSDPPKKLKGVPSLTLEEQEAANTMHALKESRKTSKRQPGTRGSNEETGTIPGVPNKFTVISATSSEETESEYSEEDKVDDEEKDDYISDNQDADDETEFDEDDIYNYKIRVQKDDDVEMTNAEVENSDKGDEEVTDAAMADAEKTSEVKDDAKKTKIPPISSSLSVSSGFGDQFLKLSSDSSLVSTVKDTTDAEINSLLEVKIQFLRVPAYTVTHLSLEYQSLAALKTQVPSVVDNYLGSKVGDVPKNQTPTVDLEQESGKSPLEILKIKKEQAEKQKMPKFTIKYTEKAALKEYDQKSALYQTMHANKELLIQFKITRESMMMMKMMIDVLSVPDRVEFR